MLSKDTMIGIVGSGAMGAGIAQVAAAAGHKVIVFDTHADALNKAQKDLGVTLGKLIEKKKITAEVATHILSNITYETEMHSFRQCGLVIEAIIENLEVKQKLFGQMEAIVKPECVLSSNTSSLSIASIASACSMPSRVIGIHFFNPAPLMPLVEIIPGILTEPTIAEQCNALITSWGKVCVMAKDTPGFIVNRVARSFYGESLRICEEGIADFATVDWAMKEFGGFKMGPFELMDFIGNDVNYKVTESVWEQFFYEPRFKPSLTQKRLYEAKLFGRKSGRGYYTYGENAPLPKPNKDPDLGKAIFRRVIAMLINEAIDTVYLKVATREDVDLAMTRGVNYPKGLLAWGDELGLENVLSALNSLYTNYGEDRYRPCVLLKQLVAAKQKTVN
jgi:3-hydroxybutyryl-CoA dehydrogenase